MSITNDDFNVVAAIAALGRGSADPKPLTPGTVYAVETQLGGVTQIDLTDDKYLPAPRRKHGITTVRDAHSFLNYWHKHSDAGSEVYADRSRFSVIGVLNAHDDGPRFADHRVVLGLAWSEQYRAWSDINKRQLSQTEFAEFIEDHRSDVVDPAAADLLELALTFQSTTKATFKSATSLKSGQRQLEYSEQIDATAGRTGKLPIPDSLTLNLPIFEGATTGYAVTARLRFRVTNGVLRLIVVLDNISDIVNAAFEGVVAELSGPTGKEQTGNPVAPPGVGVPILRGTPA